MTENDFLFCFVLISHDSNSLKSMKAASIIKSLLIKDLVVLRMCSSLTSFAHVLAMKMAEWSFACNISPGSLSVHGFPSPWQIITKRIIASSDAVGQPLPIFVTERHPPWKLATSYLVAQGEFCCHPLLFYLDPYLLFPPKGRRRNLGLLKSRPFALCRSTSLLSPRCWFFKTLWIRVCWALGVNRRCLYSKEIFFLGC